MDDVFSVSDERIGALIGKGGETKKKIEGACNVKLKIQDGVVFVEGESLDIIRAGNIIRAIDFGFSPDIALYLENPNIQLAIYNLEEIIRHSQIKRVMARIIGERGKSKIFLEQKLELDILIKDGKVGAIGDPMRLDILREAVERFATGATHTSVYKHVERRLALLENL